MAPSKSDPAKDLVTLIHDDEEDNFDSTTGSGTDSSIQQQSLDIEKTVKRTIFVSLLVLVVGAITSSSFLYLGISNEKDSKMDSFDKRSKDLAKEIQGSMTDYENAASWIHESCRNWRDDAFGYDHFQELYEYIKGGGLDFFAMEWCPNVTHAERPELEAAAANYFEGIGMDINYRGIQGLLPEAPETMEIVPREEKSFYFPIQYFEPRSNMAGLYHYDVYSAPWEQPSVNMAIETWKPVATPGFKIVASGEQESFTTVLYHPGVPIAGHSPKDLSNILIQIKALLERSVRHQTETLGVYLFDKSEDMMFLGGMHVQVKENKRELVFFPDRITLDEVVSSERIYEEDIEFAARVWTVFVTPVDDTYEPKLASVIVSGVLIFVASLLLTMWMITNMRRSIQMHRIITKAAAEAAIVSNLFPAQVRERMIQEATANRAKGNTKKGDVFLNKGKDGNVLCKDTLNNYLTSEGIFGSKPIADLHPYCTVLFADLAGFTAWSSVREPSQVFTLLEIVYHSFDTIAKRRRVFKVETVGDCYVAVTGLPEPRKDHAVVMARFAHDCLNRFSQLTRALETTLGPDTGDIGLRIGLHSGQVTAGVLRGDKGRFQLFGDTMNTASRMESTGVRNKIQCSNETADLLAASGHHKWVTPREDAVSVRGKGVLKTYWIKVLSDGSRTSSGSTADTKDTMGFVLQSSHSEKIMRLVNWNTEVLAGLLKKIVARREAIGKQHKHISQQMMDNFSKGSVPLDEVVEVLPLPAFNASAIRKQVDAQSITLDEKVTEELYLFVKEVASFYRKNPFHSFEHASHVTMSVLKMMSRIENPKELAVKRKDGDLDVEAQIHDFTFGVTSDPLSLFAAGFSALIHDLDHQGVPNSTLVAEGSPVAKKYSALSVAEQNSVDLAWNILCKPEYSNLRACIYCDEEEFKRFRMLVVNTVMATDIMDKQLGAARKARWNKAFSGDEGDEPANDQLAVNRKATIVIEHLIQASDISHTMQHWHIYIKWNERFFHETYLAFKQGRIDKDPSEAWYNGELGFFDFYIIPLAKKLFTCGVFGVSSDEFLNYAMRNRKEWELKGKEMVAQYKKNFKALYEGGEESEYGDVTDRADELDAPKASPKSLLET